MKSVAICLLLLMTVLAVTVDENTPPTKDVAILPTNGQSPAKPIMQTVTLTQQDNVPVSPLSCSS